MYNYDNLKVDVYGSPKVSQPVSEVYVMRGGVGLVEVEFCADPLPKQTWHIDSNPGQKILISEGTRHDGYRVLNATKSTGSNCYVSTLEISSVQARNSNNFIFLEEILA